MAAQTVTVTDQETKQTFDTMELYMDWCSEQNFLGLRVYHLRTFTNKSRQVSDSLSEGLIDCSSLFLMKMSERIDKLEMENAALRNEFDVPDDWEPEHDIEDDEDEEGTEVPVQ